jgi:hypothetical protein
VSVRVLHISPYLSTVPPRPLIPPLGTRFADSLQRESPIRVPPLASRPLIPPLGHSFCRLSTKRVSDSGALPKKIRSPQKSRRKPPLRAAACGKKSPWNAAPAFSILQIDGAELARGKKGPKWPRALRREWARRRRGDTLHSFTRGVSGWDCACPTTRPRARCPRGSQMSEHRADKPCVAQGAPVPSARSPQKSRRKPPLRAAACGKKSPWNAAPWPRLHFRFCRLMARSWRAKKKGQNGQGRFSRPSGSRGATEVTGRGCSGGWEGVHDLLTSGGG